MVASMVSVNLALTIGSGDSAVAINDIINGIMPKSVIIINYVFDLRINKKMGLKLIIC